MVEIPFVVVQEMKLSDLLDIWLGGVVLVISMSCLLIRLARRSLSACPHFFVLVVALSGIGQKWREGSGVVLVLWCVIQVNKNDNSAKQITNTGAKRCDNRCRVHIDQVYIFFDLEIHFFN
jgi:hypothetical protein